MSSKIVLPPLNADEYYSNSADNIFMSCSQYDDFMGCEAAALAKLRGRYSPRAPKAFIIGNYFHTAMESSEAHADFVERYSQDIFGKNGKKYAPFEQADIMLDTAKKDPEIRRFIDLEGQNEVAMTGLLFGEFPFKVRFDKYCTNGANRTIIDWKTSADIWKAEYDPVARERVSFIRNFGYVRRAAVYIEIEKQFSGNVGKNDANFFIVAISKQDPPDKEIIIMSGSNSLRQELDLALESMYANLSRIASIKAGLATPVRCGHCDYCRMTKKVSYRSLFDLDPGNYPEREDEYAELLSSDEGIVGKESSEFPAEIHG